MADITQKINLIAVPRVNAGIEAVRGAINNLRATVSKPTTAKFLPTDMPARARQIAEVRSQAIKLGDSVSRIGHHSSRALDVFKGLAIYRGFGILTRSVADFISELVNLESELHKISTLFADIEDINLQQTKREIADVATITGESMGGIAEAIYTTISAGYEEADAIKIVAQATKMAKSEHADLDTVMQGVIAQMDAYKKEGYSVTDVLDKQIALVEKGVFTFDQMVQTLPDVTTAARSAGVSIDEMNAAMAVTSRAFPMKAWNTGATALKRFLFLLTKPQFAEGFKTITYQWSGTAKSIYDSAGNMRNLTDILNDLNEAFSHMTDQQKNSAMAMLVTRERARKAAAYLIENARTVEDYTNSIESSTGRLNKNWETYQETVEYMTNTMKQEFAEIFLGAVDAFKPMLIGAKEMLELFKNSKPMIAGLTLAVTALGVSYLWAGSAEKNITLYLDAYTAAVELNKAAINGLNGTTEMRIASLFAEGKSLEELAALYPQVGAERLAEIQSTTKSIKANAMDVQSRIALINILKRQRMMMRLTVVSSMLMLTSMGLLGTKHKKLGKSIMALAMAFMTLRMVLQVSTTTQEAFIAAQFKTAASSEIAAASIISSNLGIAKSNEIVQASIPGWGWALAIISAIGIGALTASSSFGDFNDTLDETDSTVSNLSYSLDNLSVSLRKVSDALSINTGDLSTISDEAGKYVDTIEKLQSVQYEFKPGWTHALQQMGFETRKINKNFLGIPEKVGIEVEVKDIEKFKEDMKWLTENRNIKIGEGKPIKLEPNVELQRMIDEGIPILLPGAKEPTVLSDYQTQMISTALASGSEKVYGFTLEQFVQATKDGWKWIADNIPQQEFASMIETSLSPLAQLMNDIKFDNLKSFIDNIEQSSSNLINLGLVSKDTAESIKRLNQSLGAFQMLQKLMEVSTYKQVEAGTVHVDVDTSAPLISQIIAQSINEQNIPIMKWIEVPLLDTSVVNEAMNIIANRVSEDLSGMPFSEMTGEDLANLVLGMTSDTQDAALSAIDEFKQKIDDLKISDLGNAIDKMVDSGDFLTAAGYEWKGVAGDWKSLGEEWQKIQSLWEVTQLITGLIDFATMAEDYFGKDYSSLIGTLFTSGQQLLSSSGTMITQVVDGLQQTIMQPGFWEKLAEAVTVNQSISQGVTLMPYIQVNTKEDVENIDQIINDALVQEMKRVGLTIAK